MNVKMNLRIITKNHAADPEKGFLTKSISKLNGRATAMPTAWELKSLFSKSRPCMKKQEKKISSRDYRTMIHRLEPNCTIFF